MPSEWAHNSVTTEELDNIPITMTNGMMKLLNICCKFWKNKLTASRMTSHAALVINLFESSDKVTFENVLDLFMFHNTSGKYFKENNGSIYCKQM